MSYLRPILILTTLKPTRGLRTEGAFIKPGGHGHVTEIEPIAGLELYLLSHRPHHPRQR